MPADRRAWLPVSSAAPRCRRRCRSCGRPKPAPCRAPRPPPACAEWAANRSPACRRPAGPLLRSTSTWPGVTGSAGSSMRAARSAGESNTSAGPRCCSRAGVAAERFEDRAVRRQRAAQHRERSEAADGRLEGADHRPGRSVCAAAATGATARGVSRLGASRGGGELLPQGQPADTARLELQQRAQLGQHRRHPAGLVQILQPQTAAGFAVDQQRDARRGRLEGVPGRAGHRPGGRWPAGGSRRWWSRRWPAARSRRWRTPPE